MLEFIEKMEYSMLVSKSRYLCARVFGRFADSATKVRKAPSAQVFSPDSSSFRRKAGRLLLAFSWIGGLLCGIWFISAAGIPLFSWMRDGILAPVSIRRMLCVTLLPFLLSAIAVCASGSALLYALAFFKAFSMACVDVAIQALWGEAGWLMRWLFSFTSLHSAPLLYGFLLSHVGREDGLPFWEAAWLFSAVSLLGSIDFFIIAPMLARLIYS